MKDAEGGLNTRRINARQGGCERHYPSKNYEIGPLQIGDKEPYFVLRGKIEEGQYKKKKILRQRPL